MSNKVRVIKRENAVNARTESGARQGARVASRDRTQEQRLESLYRDAQRMTNRIKAELEGVRNGTR